MVPGSRGEDDAVIRLRLAPADARYARGLAAGSKAMEIFADLETELALREGGDEGLCVGYDMVEFLAPLRSGRLRRGPGAGRRAGPDEPPDHGGDPQGPRGRRRRDPDPLRRAGPGRARERDDRGRPHAPPRRPLSVPATLVDWIGAVARAQARRPAVYGDGVAWTYEELWARAGGIARHLLSDRGVRPGDRDRPRRGQRARLSRRVPRGAARRMHRRAAERDARRRGDARAARARRSGGHDRRRRGSGDPRRARRLALARPPAARHGLAAAAGARRPRVHLPDEREHRQAEGGRPHAGLAAAHGAPARLDAAVRPRGAQHRVPALLRRGRAGAAGALHGRLARRAARLRPRADLASRPPRDELRRRPDRDGAAARPGAARGPGPPALGVVRLRADAGEPAATLVGRAARRRDASVLRDDRMRPGDRGERPAPARGADHRRRPVPDHAAARGRRRARLPQPRPDAGLPRDARIADGGTSAPATSAGSTSAAGSSSPGA